MKSIPLTKEEHFINDLHPILFFRLVLIKVKYNYKACINVQLLAINKGCDIQKDS